MIKKINFLSILLMFSLTSCGNNEVKDQSDFLKSVFEKQTLCSKNINSLLNEWDNNGGGIKESLFATREQIKYDNESVIALVIRYAWESQKKAGVFVKKSEIGKWPLSDDDYRTVVSSYFGSNILSETLEECPFITYFTPIIWKRYIVDKQSGVYRKLEEVPDNLKWESPFAQEWLTYWLFANIKGQ